MIQLDRGRSSDATTFGSGTSLDRFHRDRLLSLMRMIRADNQLELRHHMSTQLVLRHHPHDGQFKNPIRMTGEKLFGLFVSLATWVATESLVGFLFPLVACEDNLVHVGHDDEIASVHVRRELWIVFATEDVRSLNGDATNHLARALHSPQPLWEELQPRFQEAVASFHLTEPTRAYIPPDKDPWLFF